MTDKSSGRLLLGGIVLMVVAWFVPMFFEGEQAWSPLQAVLLQQASQNYHDVMHGHGGSDTESIEKRETAIREAREAYIKQSLALERAESRGRRVAGAVRWAGILTVAAGLAVHFLKQFRPDA